MSEDDTLQMAAAAALCALAEHNIPPDTQELLVLGDPMRGIPPGALSAAMRAALIEFKWPDFGEHVINHEGTELSCRYIVPGLTFHDLSAIYHQAKSEANPGDEYAGNPAKWPDNRGLWAVVEAMMNAICGGRENSLPNSRPEAIGKEPPTSGA